MTEADIMGVFKQTESMLEGHFILTSGKHSAVYMQCAKLFTEPCKAEEICAALCKKITADGSVFDYVVSPAVGGIIMGYQVAKLLNTKNLFYERENGAMTLRRGFSLPQGSRVLVVEDVVTTGGSVREVMQCVRDSGSSVCAVAAIVDRSGGTALFDAPFYSLLKMDISTYQPDKCPMCANGSAAYKPGSRAL